jgi:hypothetical protein
VELASPITSIWLNSDPAPGGGLNKGGFIGGLPEFFNDLLLPLAVTVMLPVPVRGAVTLNVDVPDPVSVAGERKLPRRP